MTLVRTTLHPDVEIDVDDIEYADLQRQGLLVGQEPLATAVKPPRVNTDTAGLRAGADTSNSSGTASGGES